MKPDTEYMALALRLARRALERTWPNPMVGAVVVKGGRVVGAGYHHQAGMPHAEVEALRQAGRSARGADLFVTLEPCHCTGRTGPCCRAIGASGVARVFVGTRDPNPCEEGKGIAAVRRLGIPVVEGILEEQCRSLNEVYNVFIREKRPFVLLKLASSLDGRIATRSGDSRWISGSAARAHVHRLRARSGAVLLGGGTARRDDPQLTVRHVRGPNPAVAVLDTHLALSPRSKMLLLEREAPVFVYCSRKAERSRMVRLAEAGAVVVPVAERGGRVDLRQVLSDLYRKGVYRLLVEGGSAVGGELLRLRLVDRLEIHLASRILGSDGVPLLRFRGPTRVARAPRLRTDRVVRRGDDLCLSGQIEWP